jgi:hypothetical protein
VAMGAKRADRSPQTSPEGRQAHLRSVRSGLTEISSHVQNQLRDAGWNTKREIIRALIQRNEIGLAKVAVVYSLPTESCARALDPIMVTSSGVKCESAKSLKVRAAWPAQNLRRRQWPRRRMPRQPEFGLFAVKLTGNAISDKWPQNLSPLAKPSSE